MNSSISASWLLRGYFDFSAQNKRETTSQQIRDALCVGLDLPPKRLKMAHFPVGTNWRYVFWWRENDVDYAEAQFMASISKHHPVFSLGISMEKGREIPDKKPHLDRDKWDWSHFMEH